MDRRIGRREFLKRSASAAAALAVTSSVAPARVETANGGKRAPGRVLIIGAGLAGLSAAYELTQAGHDVTILEARLRPGGRVYTLREPFSDGLYAEAGAARIPGNHEWTLRYVKLFGLTLDPFSPSRPAKLDYIRGVRLRSPAGDDPNLSEAPLSLTPEERRLGLSGIWERYVTPAVREMGDASAAGWPPARLKEYDRWTFAEFLRRRGASADAVELLELPYYKPEDDEISALWWLREAALSEGARQVYKIRGGNDLLPKALAARLAERIRYGAAVQRIEHDGRGVSVYYTQAGTSQKLTAAHLVCAVPFTLLRRIEIHPSFSPEKRRAVEQQAYDPAARVFLQTRRRYWEEEGLSGFAVTDLPEAIWHPTFDQAGVRGLLVSYLSGRQARRVAAMKEAERVSFVSDRVERVFPGLRGNFEGGLTYSWDEDEWARGAYSILKPGEMFSLYPHAARPEGRVHFAGEHTSAWPGWMQGAIESGHRAAREIGTAPA